MRVSFGMIHKYRNKPTERDGLKFDSKSEANRWDELRLLERSGQIRDLKRQVKFDLSVNGQKVTTYRADFTYEELQAGSWVYVVEDRKGMPDQKYVIKKKLMFAVHGIQIRETKSR